MPSTAPQPRHSSLSGEKPPQSVCLIKYIFSAAVFSPTTSPLWFSLLLPPVVRWIRWCRCGGSRWRRRHSCTWGTSSAWCRNASSDIRSRTRGNTWWAPSPCLGCCSRGSAAWPAHTDMHEPNDDWPVLFFPLLYLFYRATVTSWGFNKDLSGLFLGRLNSHTAWKSSK